MADIEWLLEQIDESPEGPSIGAFFDFDGTIIDGYSAAAFFRNRLRHGDMGTRELLKLLREGINVEHRGHDVSELMRLGVAAHAGRPAEEVQRWARQIFAKHIAGMLYPQARLLIDAHNRKGHTVVMATSATSPQIAATAADLGVHHVLCTELEVDDDDVLTGAIDGPIRWGDAKADAVTEFAAANGVDLDTSFGYSNGVEDEPMLAAVGRPVALNPDDELRELATRNNWPRADLVKPRGTSPVDVVRSAAAMGVFAASVATAAGFAVVNRSRSWGANVAASMGTDLSLAAAGVRLRVVGEEHLWSHRPAVFLFNHQSQLDVFVLGALLRKDFTGVAKKELAKDPLFGPIGFLADVAYVDRSDNASARESLSDAVDTLRRGRSIAIAPEGTRSPTPRLLPFKKGPFHLAMQAGVPLVPIVLRNAGEIMAPHSFVIRPGTVDVVVLPPIDTRGWRVEDLDTHIAGVRRQYLDTLADWPG